MMALNDQRFDMEEMGMNHIETVYLKENEYVEIVLPGIQYPGYDRLRRHIVRISNNGHEVLARVADHRDFQADRDVQQIKLGW